MSVEEVALVCVAVAMWGVWMLGGVQVTVRGFLRETSPQPAGTVADLLAGEQR